MRVVGSSYEEYDALPGARPTFIKNLIKEGPARAKLLSELNPDTAALALGRVVHQLVLQPEIAETRFAVFSDTKTRGAKYEKFVKDNPGKICVLQNEMEVGAKLSESIFSNQDALGLLSEGSAEVCYSWTDADTGVLCKVFVDLDAPGHIVDLKTHSSSNPEAFCVHDMFGKYNYHVQFAMIQDGRFAVTGEKVPVYVIAPNKLPPHETWVFRIPDQALELGRKLYKEALWVYKECLNTGTWGPMYSGIIDAPMPAWWG